ncbi:MAG: DUF488 domain-containing protein [Ktedonobacteraceae bacterium]
MNVPLYTIGHGNRSIKSFLALLKRYEIDFLVDVRSQPYSRYNPQFSQTALEAVIVQHGLRYMFMGDVLGGRPSDQSCYVAGKVDYALVREKAWYQQGITRLHTAWERQLRVSILCSELRPQECHRSKLIGNTLLEQHIDVAHIDEEGELKGQVELNLLLTHGQLPLFEDVPLVTLDSRVGRARKARASHSSNNEGGEDVGDV